MGNNMSQRGIVVNRCKTTAITNVEKNTPRLTFDEFVFVSFMLNLLGDFQMVVAELGSYFPKDYPKKYRK